MTRIRQRPASSDRTSVVLLTCGIKSAADCSYEQKVHIRRLNLNQIAASSKEKNMGTISGMMGMGGIGGIAGELEQVAGAIEQAAGGLEQQAGSGMMGGPQSPEAEVSNTLQQLSQELQQITGGGGGMPQIGGLMGGGGMGGGMPQIGGLMGGGGMGGSAAGTVGQLLNDANANNVNGELSDLSNLSNQVAGEVDDGQMSASQGNQIQSDIGKMTQYEQKVQAGGAQESQGRMQSNAEGLSNQIADALDPGSATGSTSVDLSPQIGHLNP
jgi:hypothetical protein